MGLLDQFSMSDEQNQGLLAAASQILQQSGDPRRPFGLGQALGAGISTYQGSMIDAKRRKEEQEQLAMQKQMMGMKMRDAQSDFANQEAMRKRATGLQAVYAQLGQGGGMNPQGRTPASHMDGGQIVKAAQAAGMPADVGSLNQTVDMINRGQISSQSAQQQPSPAAAQDLFAQKIGFAKQLRAAGYHPEADAEEEKALKFREEYSLDLKNLQGPDGKLRPYQVSKFGGVRDTGLGVAPKMTEMKLGDRSQWIDENTVAPGQQFRIGQSPDNKASVGASYANANATRAVAGATRDAAIIQRNQATEMKLGDDYRAQSKVFKESSDAYRQINATLNKATLSPAATLASATKFMKLLDPGSVVRESELGMALAASGVLDRATNYYQTLARGRVLTPTQVADFKSITKQIYGAAQQGQRDIDQNYKKQAEAYGLRPEMVVQDLGQNAMDVSNIPKGSINMLKMNPKMRAQFDEKYGAGSAASILGK